MFHGFQKMNNETRFPDELDSIYNYNYDKENLSIKIKENKLICSLINSFDCEKLSELLSLRKYRYEKFKYEYMYESMIEQIEGCANNVELNVLKQLSPKEYHMKLEMMKDEIVKPQNLFPIRIVSYDIGTLLLEILKENNINFNKNFDNKTFLHELVLSSDFEECVISEDVSFELAKYNDESKKIVLETLEKNNIIFSGEESLLGFNVYNARRYETYIISRYFVMYGNENNPNVLYGDFVIKSDYYGKVNKIYKI
jgi:hypothetical protein